VIDADEPSSATDRANFAWQWKQITYGSIDLEQGKYTTVDVDYDLSGGDTEEEKVLSIDLNGMAQVLDYQEGDVNFSTIPPPGFDQDIQMYTITRPGTYLEIKEGKLYSADPTRQFISTASKKDSVDIIQRVFRLSNNTERFCDLNGNLMGPLLEDGPQPAGLPNPVEACNNCFSPANIEKTCMDTTNNIIMIRSRVKDLHGRKYVTDVQGDPYIAF